MEYVFRGQGQTENPAQLKEFRALVLKKTIRFWEDYKDIKIAIGETVSTMARRDDLLGWVRPTPQADVPVLAGELARLSKENSQLRRQRTGAVSSPIFEDMLVGRVDRLLKSNNLSEFLSANREALSSSAGLEIEDPATVDALKQAGILEHVHGSTNSFAFTRYGQLTLSRIEAPSEGSPE